jgi:HSP20 family protein
MLPAMIKRKSYYPTWNDHIFGNDLFSKFFSDGADYSVPAVNIRETDNSYQIEMAVPGIAKDDLNIKLENDILTIASERKQENDKNSDGYMRREFAYHTFSRSFELPEMVNTEKIKATHTDGVLTIELPKVKEETANKSKTIKIS